ncbi:hypothetical protein ABGB12_27085 [Actinocorallia sp. B10E7]|uniref:hypothetical protein n=1 Tax=Actinocorallia sp. B10E7 TaxID=3153558 RepID=UPI00325F7290
MANWTPPPSPQQGPDPQNEGAQPGHYDPFAQQQPPQQPEYSDHTNLGTPLMQPGAGTPPPFVPSQPGGQIPGQQPFAGQGTPPPFMPQGQPGQFGQPGYPMQPGALHQPRKGMNPLPFIAAVLVLVVGAGAFAAIKVMGKAEKKRRTIAVPSVSVDVPTLDVPTFSAPPSVSPPPTTSAPAKTVRQVPGNVLKATMKTAYGTTFRRVGDASGPCSKAAPTDLKRTLAKYPCIGDFKGAVYSDSKKKAVVTVIVMPLKNAAAVSAVKKSEAYPYLINPDKGSGARSIGNKRVSTWSRVYDQGNLIVFSMAYRSDLAKKDAGNVASTAAQHIGAEVTGVLIWS